MVDAPEAALEQKLKPSDILTQINTKQGVKDYVGADAAVIWFYEDFPPPRGGIRTKLLNADPVIFKASVWVDGKLIATGHANPEGNSNTLKKVESAAVRRALANAGYSTKKAIIRLARVMVKEGISDKLGSGKKSQERRVGSRLEPKPGQPTEPRPTWATPENLDTLKDVLAKNDIQWSDVPRLAETIRDANDWRMWEAFAASGKAAAQNLIGLRDARLANQKPAAPKAAPIDVYEETAAVPQDAGKEPTEGDFLNDITYDPKMIASGTTTVPVTSFLHKANISKLKARVQQFYLKDGKLNTFHMNGSICKMLNTGALKAVMTVDEAVKVIEDLKTTEAQIEGENVPF